MNTRSLDLVCFLVLFCFPAYRVCAATARQSHKGVRGGRSERSGRQLQSQLQSKGKGGSGGGGGSNELIELEVCETDPEAAIEEIRNNGFASLGDQNCYLDPIGACPGGCCRIGLYFACDITNFLPHLPCVCNENTQGTPIGVITMAQAFGANSTNTTARTGEVVSNLPFVF
ncbi:expressed unknown protein [Seminavis robusta]|uniref:Uncharacterized protein n=1 Tax=Seminavis robusta TaxID=568900 RepID=A0A9N8HXY4_9STRA|nr:expressed unknown protein [Seminavis robusta]|eukprot:Sro1897_g304060.1 n/a (172) ;mRNA; r:2582-3097